MSKPHKDLLDSGLISIGFLMGVAHRKLSGAFQAKLKPYGITPEQWVVLYHIVQAEGEVQKNLALKTEKDKPTITRILHQLESKHLIVRRSIASDRRLTCIFSTSTGKELIEETLMLDHSITDEMVACISKEGHDQLLEYLLTINQTFGK